MHSLTEARAPLSGYMSENRNSPAESSSEENEHAILWNAIHSSDEWHVLAEKGVNHHLVNSVGQTVLGRLVAECNTSKGSLRLQEFCTAFGPNPLICSACSAHGDPSERK